MRGVLAGEGREGMTAEQVLRAAVLKQTNTFTYEELSFHLAERPALDVLNAKGPRKQRKAYRRSIPRE